MSRKTKSKIRKYEGEPWGKQGFESPHHYTLFTYFMGLGSNRRMADLPELLRDKCDYEYALPTLRSIAHRNAWYDRAGRWDVYLGECLLHDKENVIREMEIRHSTGAKVFLKEIENVLRKGLSDDSEYKLTYNKQAYFLDALTRSYERVARLERLTYGEITDKKGIEKEVTKNIKDLDKIMNDPEVAARLSTIFEVMEIDDADFKPKAKEKLRVPKDVEAPTESKIY